MKGPLIFSCMAALFLSSSVFAHLPDDDISKTITDPGMIPASPQQLHQKHKKHAKVKHRKHQNHKPAHPANNLHKHTL